MTITTASFDDAVFQDQVAATIINELVGGAPLCRSLNQLATSRGGVVIPRSAPNGFGWVAEATLLPTVDLNDSSDIVTVVKLGGTFDLSNESLNDESIDVASLLAMTVVDSMSHELDTGALYGSTALEPDGLIAKASAGDSSGTMREGIIKSWAELIDAGADPSRIIACGSARTLATELARETLEGQGVHMDGAIPRIGPGIELRMTPAMNFGEVLVIDAGHNWLISRSDFSVDFDASAGFRTDTTAVRVVGRFGVASPVPAKSMRLLTYDLGS